MITEHTPGPWEVEDGTKESFQEFLVRELTNSGQTLDQETASKIMENYTREQFEAGWQARGEADTEKIRRDCGACGGTGWQEPPNNGPDDPYPGDQCEYCGRPQLAIQDMPPPAAQPAKEPKR